MGFMRDFIIGRFIGKKSSGMKLDSTTDMILGGVLADEVLIKRLDRMYRTQSQIARELAEQNELMRSQRECKSSYAKEYDYNLDDLINLMTMDPDSVPEHVWDAVKDIEIDEDHTVQDEVDKRVLNAKMASFKMKHRR